MKEVIKMIIREVLAGENKIIYHKQITRGTLDTVQEIPKEEEKTA